MSYVIYNKDTTITLVYRRKEYYASERAAKAARTRILKAKPELGITDDFAIAEVGEFRENIEKTKIVRNLMSGVEVEIPVNTPRSCDPSSELYWSM